MLISVVLSKRTIYLAIGLMAFLPEGHAQTSFDSKKYLILPDTISGTSPEFHFGLRDTLFSFTPIKSQFDAWYLDSIVFGSSYMANFRPKDDASSQHYNLNSLSFEPINGSSLSFYDARGLVINGCAAEIDLYFIKSGTGYYLLEGPWLFQLSTTNGALIFEAEFVIDLNYQRLDSLVKLGEIPVPSYYTDHGKWEPYSIEEMLQTEWYVFFTEKYRASAQDLEALLKKTKTASIPLTVEEHTYSDAHSGSFCGC